MNIGYEAAGQTLSEPAEYPALQRMIDETEAHLNALNVAINNAELAVNEIAGHEVRLAGVAPQGVSNGDGPVKQSRLSRLGDQINNLRSLTTRVEELARRLRAI